MEVEEDAGWKDDGGDLAGVRVALVALLDLGVLDVVVGILVFEGVLGTLAGAFVLIGEEGS